MSMNKDGSGIDDDAEPASKTNDGTSIGPDFDPDTNTGTGTSTGSGLGTMTDTSERTIPGTLANNVTPFRRPGEPQEHLRIVEAVLFAASEPLDEASLHARLPDGAELGPLLDELKAHYATRGVNLVQLAGKWAFRTADDLSFIMHREAIEQKRLSRAGLETLAIIAYHQPVTRAEIEEVRGVAVSKGTLDVFKRRSGKGRDYKFFWLV